MALQQTIARVLDNASRLKASKSANEANTKASLIEPILGALGWDPFDLESVEREVRVYGGTLLDYALKLDGVPRLYVEAKGINESLDDPKFIVQTVNYANSDGVQWCVLTNGLRYCVYKTNESVQADKKLLYEVDLADDTVPVADKVKLLRRLSRESVANGDLDAWGEMFTDRRVREALAVVAADPPAELLAALQAQLGHPPVPDSALRRSLARELGAVETPPTGGAGAKPGGPKHAGLKAPIEPPKIPEYDLAHHFGDTSALINELWEALDKHATALGGDVTRRIRKTYIGYYRGKRSFFTAEVQKRRLIVWLSLTKQQAQPWSEELMRDVSKVGHHGMGDIEFSLASPEHLDGVRSLISLAYACR